METASSALLGCTIGNYRINPRRHLLARIAETMAINDCLLLGTDLVKNEDRLINAYDDQAGVTAAFNKNVLAVINRTLGLAIDPDSFEHRAQWNRLHEHIEMHLVAIEPVNLPIPGAGLQLDPGDHLLTEISAKFTSERLTADLKAAGLRLTDSWTDGDYLISLSQRT